MKTLTKAETKLVSGGVWWDFWRAKRKYPTAIATIGIRG